MTSPSAPSGELRAGQEALRRPTVLAQADTRDLAIYAGLVARGYRLIGFPREGAEAVRQRGVEMLPVDLSGYHDSVSMRRAEQIAASMIPDIQSALDDPALGLFLGLTNRRELASLRSALAKAARSQVAAAAYTVESFHRLAGQHDLHLVLLRSEIAHPGRALTLAARERAIPSLYLVHAVPITRVSGQTISADVAALYGESSVDWYAALGNAPERMAITGNPAWEAHRRAAGAVDQGVLKRALGLDPEVPMVLFATAFLGLLMAVDFRFPAWVELYAGAVVDALATVHRHRPLHLVVKAHPMDPGGASAKAQVERAHRAGLDASFVSGWVTPELIAAADVVLCIDSNLGIEALLLERPVVSLRLSDVQVDYIYHDDDGVVIARTVPDIVDVVEAALGSPPDGIQLARRAKSLYRFNYLCDGRASERVLHLIDTMIAPDRGVGHLERGGAACIRTGAGLAERAATGREHLTHAENALRAGRLHEAAYVAGRAAPFLKAPAPAYFLRAYALLGAGNAQGAVLAFEQATKLDPTNPDAHNGLASALHAAGRLEDAEAALRRSLALAPDHADGLANLGQVLLDQGKPADALVCLQRASALLPDDVEVAGLLARARACL